MVPDGNITESSPRRIAPVTPNHSGVTVVIQCCYSSVTMVLQWCYSGDTVVLQ
jgi:hypothetical protein